MVYLYQHLDRVQNRIICIVKLRPLHNIGDLSNICEIPLVHLVLVYANVGFTPYSDWQKVL